MNGQTTSPVQSPPDSAQVLQQPDIAQWGVNILMVVQAVQRLHAAFDAKFIQSKGAP